MTEIQNNKPYDLEERTHDFAKNVVLYLKTMPKTISNFEYAKQLIRSSGSVGANYIEANEALSKKDFIMRVKISRKEAKESIYWLSLVMETNEGDFSNKGKRLLNEGVELKKILSSILEKSR